MGDKMATQAHDIEKYFLAVLVVFGLGRVAQTIAVTKKSLFEADWVGFRGHEDFPCTFSL